MRTCLLNWHNVLGVFNLHSFGVESKIAQEFMVTMVAMNRNQVPLWTCFSVGAVAT